MLLVLNMVYGVCLLNTPYWFNPNIHNFGNTGFKGRIHAEMAKIATVTIDNIRYHGRNIREELYDNYKDKVILDLCCGIGISTAPGGIGVDTSIEMLNVARRDKTKEFYCGNAENFNLNRDIDIVTCMFAFHEMPIEAQLKVKANAENMAKEEVVIVDISSNYKPKEIMLSGEPYLLNYLNNIDYVLEDYNKEIYIKDHVSVWRKKITF